MQSVKPSGYETRWLALLFINFSLFIVALDSAVLNAAIPTMSRDLDATSADIQWIIDAYSLMFAALLLTTGALSDRYGRKRWLQIGVAMFGTGSVVASLANSVEMLIAARVFLGIAGALILPSTLSLVVSTFPKDERATAIGIWTATFGAAFALGPFIGGFLVEQFSWPAVFTLNIPIAIIALVGGYFFIAESHDPNAPRIDRPGVVLSTAGLFAMVYAIIRAGEVGSGDSVVLILSGVAVVLLVAFVLWEIHTEHPMMPMQFFLNPSFSVASVAISLSVFSLLGTILFISQFLQTVQGYAPAEAGIRSLPLAVTFIVVSGIAPLVASRLGIKYTVALGIIISAGGLYYSSIVYAVEAPYIEIAISLAIISGGLGLVMAPATDSIMESVPDSKAGIGSAMNDTTRGIGGAMGVAVLGTVLNEVYLDKVAVLQSQLSETAYEGVRDSVQGAHLVAADGGLSSEVATMILDVADNAFVAGITEAMFIGTFIMLGASLLVLFFLPDAIRSSEDTAKPQP